MAHSWTKTWGATGFCFHSIQYERVSMQEAKLAKEKMHGRLACGRPLVVHLAGEKYMEEAGGTSSKGGSRANKMHLSDNGLGQMSRTAKIAAIKNKLRTLEEESSSSKKQKHTDSIS